MSLINLDALRATPLQTDPYDYLVVPEFLSADALQRVNRDYPAIDSAANARCVGGVAGPIHAAGSRTALVVNTNEELLIARDTFALAQS